jgi:hypothetical protein
VKDTIHKLISKRPIASSNCKAQKYLQKERKINIAQKMADVNV